MLALYMLKTARPSRARSILRQQPSQMLLAVFRNVCRSARRSDADCRPQKARNWPLQLCENQFSRSERRHIFDLQLGCELVNRDLIIPSDRQMVKNHGLCGPEPGSKAQTAAVHQRARGYRKLMAACTALEYGSRPHPCRIGFGTAWAKRPVGPTHRNQSPLAGALGSKMLVHPFRRKHHRQCAPMDEFQLFRCQISHVNRFPAPPDTGGDVHDPETEPKCQGLRKNAIG